MIDKRSGSFIRQEPIRSVAWLNCSGFHGPLSIRFWVAPENRSLFLEIVVMTAIAVLSTASNVWGKLKRPWSKSANRRPERYNKAYPGELVHFDTKRLPYLKGEDQTLPREYLFVAIDDYSRELYAGIYPDKTQYSAELFLKQVIDECPYTIEYTYSDNGKEYKGTAQHAFVKTCIEYGIGQKFTRVNRPQTNGKAERVIRTLMEMWHQKETFSSRQNRQISLNRFINFYNVVKPHKGIDNMTPYEKLTGYFYPETINNAL